MAGKLNDKEFNMLMDALSDYVDGEKVLFTTASLIGLLACDRVDELKELIKATIDASPAIDRRVAERELDVTKLKVKLLEMKEDLVEKMEA